MCLRNNQPVNEYSSPCDTCADFLNTCMPIIIDGFIWGECDLYYCEFCSCYEECNEGVYEP